MPGSVLIQFAALAGRRYDLIICNFANADMVGHTGVYEATVEACRVTDRCVGRIAEAVLDQGGGQPCAVGPRRCSPASS